MASTRQVLRRAMVVAGAVLVSTETLRTEQQTDLASVLASVGGRVQQYYDRVTSIVCTETVSQQELRSNLRPTGKPRETTYELSVVRQPEKAGQESGLNIERTLISVNGRPARRNDRPACTDPKSVATEPLAFLLPRNQPKYRFSLAPVGSGSPSGVALDFELIAADSTRITWSGDCFEAEGGGARGRVWLDAQTSDVVQLETRLAKAFRIPVPGRLGSPITSAITVERAETTVRFRLVDFQDPPETLILPESTVGLTVFRGVPSLRTTQRFSNFRRFLSEIKIMTAG